MIRGTTPTLKIKLNGISTSRLASVYITFKQGDKEVTKTDEDITVESEDMLSVPLTQEDTLSLGQGYVYIQLRAMTDNGVAIASKSRIITMEEVLKEGVIT